MSRLGYYTVGLIGDLLVYGDDTWSCVLLATCLVAYIVFKEKCKNKLEFV